MIIYVDIDNTITITEGMDYKNAKPVIYKIDKINELYEKGNYIVYWTARGVGSGKDYFSLTEKQLNRWGCKYHELRLDKPVFDIFIDDKNLRDIDDIEKFNAIF